MKKIITTILVFFVFSVLQAQELGKSEQKKLEEALENLEAAEKSNNGKDFKKAYKKVESNLKSLQRKFGDNPDVKSLETKLAALDEIAILEEFRSDAESAIDKLKDIFQKIKSGRKTNEREIAEKVSEVQSNILKLKNSQNARFNNTIDAAKNTLAEAKDLGIEVKSQEEVEQQMALEKAMQSLNYGQAKVVKSLEKSIVMAKESGNYSRLSGYMEQAQSDIKELSDVSDNLKVKTLIEEYEKEVPRVAVYKTVTEVEANIRKMNRNVEALEKSVNRASEYLTDIDFTKGADRVQLSHRSNTISEAIVNLTYAEQNYTLEMKNIKNQKIFIETTKEENVNKTVFEASELLKKWDNSFAQKDSIIKKSITIAEKLTSNIKNEFSSLQKEIKNASRTPEELQESIRVFQSYLHMGGQDFTNRFESVSEITKLSLELVALEKTRENYDLFLDETKNIHNYLQHGDTSDYTLRHYEKANELKGDDENLKQMLTHYEKLFTVWEKANKELVAIKEKMTQKIRAASEATAKAGYQKFKNSWKQVEPRRLPILQDLESYKGKFIVRGNTWDLQGDGSYGWHINYGDDKFLYVWDSLVYEAIKPIWQEHEKVFNNFRQQVLKKYNLPINSNVLVHWTFLNFENTDIIAVVNGASSYKPKETARDEYGNTITFEGTSVQIVQLRMIGFHSKSYTYWLDGVNMNSKLDFSDIVVK